MRRGVGVRTGDDQPRLCNALLRTHDVKDALPDIAHAEKLDIVLARVAHDDLHHVPDFGIGYGIQPPGTKAWKEFS